MRIRPEETGPINWILFCPWLAMRWDWGTCGGSLILPSKMVEVRVLGQWVCVPIKTKNHLSKSNSGQSLDNLWWLLLRCLFMLQGLQRMLP